MIVNIDKNIIITKINNLLEQDYMISYTTPTVGSVTKNIFVIDKIEICDNYNFVTHQTSHEVLINGTPVEVDGYNELHEKIKSEYMNQLNNVENIILNYLNRY